MDCSTFRYCLLSCCPMQLSVVIVHYEVPAYLEQCLCSLGIALHSEDAEVIVVDNGASTQNKPGLLDRFPHVKWIPSGSNLGFAAGCNLGWQRAQGDVILFLNPDTMITSIALNGSVAALAHAAAVGCRLLNGSGFFLPESKRTIPSIRAAAFKMMGLAALFPRSAYFNQYALGNVPDRAGCKVEVLTGAFLAVQRSVLEKLGGFDASFFLYGEDVDLCRRMKEAGHTSWYEGSAAVIHCKGASSAGRNAAYFHHFYRAMSIYARKYYTPGVATLLRLIIHCREWLHRSVHRLATIIFPVPVLRPEACHWQLEGEASDCQLLADMLRKKWGETLRVSFVDGRVNQQTPPDFSAYQNSVRVFCIGKMSLESVIKKIEEAPGGVNLYWHSNSHSMVGSGHSYILLP